jgi:peptide/nickel transport system permease protein
MAASEGVQSRESVSLHRPESGSRAGSIEIAVSASTLLVIVLLSFLGPVVYAMPDPVGGNVLEATRPLFSEGHLLGTDLNGNDTLSRLLYGGRVSLAIAVAVNLVGLLVGGFVGALSAQLGGTRDAIIMRTLDVLIAFPSLIFALAIVRALGPGPFSTIWALSFVSIPAFARIARGATLRLREQPFLTAAALGGTGLLRTLVGHIAPNIVAQLVTFALLGVGIVIVLEGALSFLGLGVPPPRPSWGNMIAQGQQALTTSPELVLLPSILLFVTVLSLNVLGEALRARRSQ